MTIQWFGQSFFKLNTKNQQGEDVVIAIDPLHKDYGLKVPTKFGADILLVTHGHKDHSNVDLIKNTTLSEKPFLISGPGEYEVKGVMVYGIPSWHDDKQGAERGENIMYLMETEGVWIAHLGDLGQKTLENGQLEQLQGVDVLMIPVGGTFTINAKEAAGVISQIEPRVIIPMHYKIPGLTFYGKSVEGIIDDEKKFIKEVGLKPEVVEGKFRVTKKDLPQEETKLILMPL